MFQHLRYIFLRLRLQIYLKIQIRKKLPRNEPGAASHLNLNYSKLSTLLYNFSLIAIEHQCRASRLVKTSGIDIVNTGTLIRHQIISEFINVDCLKAGATTV